MVAVVALALANLLTTRANAGTGIDHLFLRLSGGPISGWWGALQAEAFRSYPAEALTLLVPTTLAAAAPLYFYLRRPSRGVLALGVLLWYFTGYLFSIGIAT
ncbi:MAG: hypothetical protein JWP97_2654 [Labilithrix sp.]|nr:hypothetical protein [Labilithrix sp.]